MVVVLGLGWLNYRSMDRLGLLELRVVWSDSD
jgi:hypothetical protein